MEARSSKNRERWLRRCVSSALKRKSERNLTYLPTARSFDWLFYLSKTIFTRTFTHIGMASGWLCQRWLTVLTLDFHFPPHGFTGVNFTTNSSRKLHFSISYSLSGNTVTNFVESSIRWVVVFVFSISTCQSILVQCKSTWNFEWKPSVAPCDSILRNFEYPNGDCWILMKIPFFHHR